MNKSGQKKFSIAVFDIDKTLLPGTSAEIQLIRFLYKKKIIKAEDIIKSVMRSLFQIFKGFDWVIYNKSRYLEGIEKKLIISYLPEFFGKYIWPHLSEELLQYLKDLKKKNFEIIIISGTLDFLLKPFIEKLKADGGIGSHMEVNDGKFSGRITDIYPYKYGKILALNRYVYERTVDYANSYAFADSLADIPLLKLFGNPVVINPGLLLRLRAKIEKWTVMKLKR